MLGGCGSELGRTRDSGGDLLFHPYRVYDVCFRINDLVVGHFDFPLQSISSGGPAASLSFSGSRKQRPSLVRGAPCKILWSQSVQRRKLCSFLCRVNLSYEAAIFEFLHERIVVVELS